MILNSLGARFEQARRLYRWGLHSLRWERRPKRVGVVLLAWGVAGVGGSWAPEGGGGGGASDRSLPFPFPLLAIDGSGGAISTRPSGIWAGDAGTLRGGCFLDSRLYRASSASSCTSILAKATCKAEFKDGFEKAWVGDSTEED